MLLLLRRVAPLHCLPRAPSSSYWLSGVSHCFQHDGSRVIAAVVRDTADSCLAV